MLAEHRAEQTQNQIQLDLEAEKLVNNSNIKTDKSPSKLVIDDGTDEKVVTKDHKDEKAVNKNIKCEKCSFSCSSPR